jgi:uncharacterized repeat protein (TIGR01451 family)
MRFRQQVPSFFDISVFIVTCLSALLIVTHAQSVAPPFFVAETNSAADGAGAEFNRAVLNLNVGGNNRLLLAAWHAEFDGGLPDDWSVTNNGVPGTLIVETDGYTGGAGNRRFRIYYWLNPPTGTNTIVVSNPSSGANELAVSAILLNNVSQTNPVGPVGLDVSTVDRTAESETVATNDSDLVVHVIANALYVRGVLGEGETSRSIANDGHHIEDGDASLWISTKLGRAASTTVSSSGWARRVINGAAITIHSAGGPGAPTISTIANQSTPLSTPTAPIPFTLEDSDTPLSTLVVTGSSSNNTLVTNAGIVFGGSDGNRTVTITPVTGQAGTAQITLTVSDGVLSNSTSFELTVTTPTAGLVGAYSFNEGFGTTAGDGSGNGNTATLSGATWATTGKYGNALSFNGTSSRVTIADASSLDLMNGLTLEAWVQPSVTLSGWRSIVTKDVDRYYLMASSNPQNRPAVGGTFGTTNQNVFGTAGLAVNTWTHVAATYDRTTIQLYVNGVQVASGAQTAAISTSNAVLAIGANSYGEYFNGLIDEVRIYNRALTAAEIQADMATPLGGGGTLISDLTVNKTHAGSFTQGQTGANYTLTARNVGSAATTGTVTVSDTLPTGVTASSAGGIGWACTLGPPVSCTRSDALPAGGSYPAITLTVNVASNAPASVTNTATVSGGGEVNTANNSASDVTAINGSATPDLTVTKTHAGSFTQGQTGASYTVTVSNAGTGATTGTVAVSDALPTGLTASSAGGLGWACTVGPPVSCTRNDAVGAGSSYPAITLTVNVASNAPASVTNTVTVSGGGEVNTANSSASDVTAITSVPDTQPPTAPPSASATASGPQITVSWTAATDNVGVTAYHIERCPGASCSNFAEVGSTASLSYVDSGLAASTSYSYRVRAGDAAGLLGPYSPSATATTGALPSGLVGAYSFDEGLGTTAGDGSGNGNTGTLSGATWTTAGKYGNALSFNGTSSRVTIADALSLDLTDAMTLEAWVRPSVQPSNWRSVITKDVDRYYLMASSNSQNRPAVGGTFNTTNQNVFGGSRLAANTWAHLAATYDRTTIRLYVNGVQVATAAQTAAISTSTGLLAIGANFYGEYFNGLIDEVRIYNRALTAAEIQTDMAAPLGGGGTLISDLTITKTHAGSFTQGQTGANYTLTVSNGGTGAASGTVTVSDTLPTGLTATNAVGSGWACTVGPTVSCTRVDSLAAGGSYPAITLTLNVASNAPASVTNTAAVSGGGEVNTANNTASDVTAITALPDLTITKTHAGSFTQGQTGASYTLTARNVGNAASTGTVTVSDTLPTGLTAANAVGSGWACTVGPPVSCTRADALAAGGSYPAITLTVNVASNAPTSVTNTAAVSGGGEINTANNTASDVTAVTALPDLTVTKTHAGSFTQGQTGASYTLTARNVGSAATTGTVTVSDTLPAGLTASSAGGLGWACTVGPPVSCTRNDAVGAGSSYPAITLTVNVASNAPASVTNTVTVSGGGEVNTANNSASDVTAINGSATPDLTVTKTHAGSFTQGQTGASYTVTVSNAGTGATTGTVAVSDALPTGLTASSAGGLGWACTVGPPVSCTRNDAVGAGSSYPAITLTVNVASNAPASVTNTVTVSGGGEVNTANSSASDVTAITSVPDTQPPTAPPSASATASGPQITVSWTAATDNVGVTAYHIERCPGASCSNFAEVGSTASLSYVDSGLAASTSYSYRVRAGDAAGLLGPYSPSATATTGALPSGLVGAYSFDEGLGTTAGDGSGNGNTGTLSGATWTTAGKYGNALSFNGTSSRLTIADASSLDLTNAMTLEAWVQPSVTLSGWRSIVTKDVDRYYLMASSNPQNRPAVGGTFGTTNQNVFGTASLAVNTWIHVAATYERTTIRLYVNGVQVASGAQTAAISTSNSALTIGADSYGEYFNGLIDEVRIYNRALTAAEIQADMATPLGGSAGLDTTPPSAPSNLTATPTSASQIQLSWSASNDNVAVTTYAIERCQGAGCNSFTQVLTVTAPQVTFIDSGLTATTPYSYRVRASDAAQNLSSYSNVASTTTPVPDVEEPSAPGPLTATALSGTQVSPLVGCRHRQRRCLRLSARTLRGSWVHGLYEVRYYDFRDDFHRLQSQCIYELQLHCTSSGRRWKSRPVLERSDNDDSCDQPKPRCSLFIRRGNRHTCCRCVRWWT